eukprot:8941987-Prorocentrum_lima.AAC.1
MAPSRLPIALLRYTPRLARWLELVILLGPPIWSNPERIAGWAVAISGKHHNPSWGHGNKWAVRPV